VPNSLPTNSPMAVSMSPMLLASPSMPATRTVDRPPIDRTADVRRRWGAAEKDEDEKDEKEEVEEVEEGEEEDNSAERGAEDDGDDAPGVTRARTVRCETGPAVIAVRAGETMLGRGGKRFVVCAGEMNSQTSTRSSANAKKCLLHFIIYDLGFFCVRESLCRALVSQAASSGCLDAEMGARKEVCGAAAFAFARGVESALTRSLTRQGEGIFSSKNGPGAESQISRRPITAESKSPANSAQPLLHF
jgi:hypothetical protein